MRWNSFSLIFQPLRFSLPRSSGFAVTRRRKNEKKRERSAKRNWKKNTVAIHDGAYISLMNIVFTLRRLKLCLAHEPISISISILRLNIIYMMSQNGQKFNEGGCAKLYFEWHENNIFPFSFSTFPFFMLRSFCLDCAFEIGARGTRWKIVLQLEAQGKCNSRKRDGMREERDSERAGEWKRCR